MTAEQTRDWVETIGKPAYERIAEMVAALRADRDRLEELRNERENLADAVEEARSALTDAQQALDQGEPEFDPAVTFLAPDEGGDTGPIEQLWTARDAAAKAFDAARNELDDWDNNNKEELDELTAAVTLDGDEVDEERARQRIEEDALSVEVRSGWHAPGGGDSEPAEFCILLTTGGPAVRIIGDLDRGEPTRPRLEVQDWFKPWTGYTGADSDTLLAYCQCFYFGA
jgi:hypothetical protein